MPYTMGLPLCHCNLNSGIANEDRPTFKKLSRDTDESSVPNI